MKVVKIEDITTIDYPEHVSSLIYLEGCNLRCPYCYNWRLVIEENDAIPLKEVYKRLENNKFIDSVAITGGEPTIHPELPFFVAELKSRGYKVKLDANGTNPVMLKNILKDVDYVAMDVKTDIFGYDYWFGGISNKILNSIDIIIASRIQHEFRCTAVSPFLDEDSLMNILDMIKGEKLILQEARLEDVLKPDFPMEKFKYLQDYKDMLRP